MRVEGYPFPEGNHEKDLTNNTDSEFNLIAERDSKRTIDNAHVVEMVYLVHKKICKGSDCDLLELTQSRISDSSLTR